MDSQLTTAPYRDADLSTEERVSDLLAQMTLDEKLAQLGGVMPDRIMDGDAFSHEKARHALSDGIGHISRISGTTLLGPAESATMANAVQRFLAEETRLGIPAIVHEESLAGYQARGATCFPQAIGLAATWSPDLIEEMAAVIRCQMRAAGAHQSLSPVLDIARDPRWGRTEETYGEDPHLAGRMGVAYVRGLQGDNLREGVAATAKHFIGYGLSEGGMNWAPAHINQREMLEVYAAPFEAAIRETGLASVMNAYHEIDGVPCGASKTILTDLLRDTLGFDGYVVSDYFTLQMLVHYHHLTDSKAEAAALALEAGLDVELPTFSYYRTPLREAIESGRVSQSTLDESLRRVLRLKFALGLFEEPFVDAGAATGVLETPSDRALARRIAQKSIVLLKNDGLLPLDRPPGTIAVIGPCANSRRLLQGDYHYPTHLEIVHGPIDEKAPGDWGGTGVRATDVFPDIVTVIDGIRSRAPQETEITFEEGCGILTGNAAGIHKAVAAAKDAEVAIVCVGGRSGLVEGCTSGESSDRAELGLPGMQQALVDAVLDTGTPTVVLLINGAPLSLPEIAERAPAVVEAWLPGEEGGNAVADVLFGDVNPSGRLPVTIPRHVGQVPRFYNHKPSGGRSQWRTNYVDLPAAPLYPFGHGLSYTTFEYSDLVIEPGETATDAPSFRVQVTVSNTGFLAGDEVVQIYIHDPVASITRPVKQLVAFRRVTLGLGEEARVEFEVNLKQLAFYDREMRFIVEAGEIEVMAGASSEDIRLRGSLNLTGETRVLRQVQKAVVP